MSETSNPLALWQSLSPAVQQQLGALMLAQELALQVATEDADTYAAEYIRAAEKSAGACENAISDLIVEHLAPDAYDEDDNAIRPDLNTLGIRQCAKCGCTQEHSCATATGPCHWTGPTRCSACPTPATEA